MALSAACTSLPPLVVDGTCGNGVVDRGEQCDPGRLQASSEECNATCLLRCSVASGDERSCPAETALACVVTDSEGNGFCAAPSGSFAPFELLSSDAEFEVANVFGDYRSELVLYDNNSIEIRSNIRFAENSATELISRDESFVSPIGRVVVANIDNDEFADLLVASSSGLHVFAAKAGADGGASSLAPSPFAYGELAQPAPVYALASVGDVPSRQLYQIRFEDELLSASTVAAPREEALHATVPFSRTQRPDCFSTRAAKLITNGANTIEQDVAFTLFRQTLDENPACTSEDTPGVTSVAEKSIFLVKRAGLSHSVELRTLAPVRGLDLLSTSATLRLTSRPTTYQIDTAELNLPPACERWLGVTSIFVEDAGPPRLGLATVSLADLDPNAKSCSVDSNGPLPGGTLVTDFFRELLSPDGEAFCTPAGQGDALSRCEFDDLQIFYTGECEAKWWPKLTVLALRKHELFRFDTSSCDSPDLIQTDRVTLGSGDWAQSLAYDFNHDGVNDYLGRITDDDDIEVMRSNPSLPGTFVYDVVDTRDVVTHFVVADFDGDGLDDLAYVERAADGLGAEVFAAYGDGTTWSTPQFLASFAEIISLDAAVLGVSPAGGLIDGAAELVVAGRREGTTPEASLYIFQGGATRFMSAPVMVMSEMTENENGDQPVPVPTPFKVRAVTRAVVGDFVGVATNERYADVLLIAADADDSPDAEGQAKVAKPFLAAGQGGGGLSAALPVDLGDVDLGNFGVEEANWTAAAGDGSDKLVGIDADPEAANTPGAAAHQDLVQMSLTIPPGGASYSVDAPAFVSYETSEYYGRPLRLTATEYAGTFAGVVGTFFLPGGATGGGPAYRLVWWGAQFVSANDDQGVVIGGGDIAPCFDATAIDIDAKPPMDLAVVCAAGIYGYVGGAATDPVTLLQLPSVGFDTQSRMRAGDIDGNGVADLVVVDSTKRVWVLLQKTITQADRACATGELSGDVCE
ncbi:MAG: hypothetical protein IPL79_02725 [Myxococcales bacterium]|nr:hypothetical protein [Myxococcales bacterium]